MKEGIAGKSIYRKDYTAYPWDIVQLDLHFDIGLETTVVRAEMEFQLIDAVSTPQDIILNGSDLELVSITLNGHSLTPDDYVVEGETLTIPDAPHKSVLKTEVIIHPATDPVRGPGFPENYLVPGSPGCDDHLPRYPGSR